MVVVLGHYLILRPSDPRTDLSGTSTSGNPQLVEAPRLPPRTEATPIAAQESAPIVGSSNAIQPESIGDTVDREINPPGSSEAKTPESVPPVEVVPPASQQSAPIAGSLNAAQPESVRDTVDPEIKLRGSFEANTPASSEDMPSSDPSKPASIHSPPIAARPLPVPPIEAVPPTSQQRAPPPRVARGTTALLSEGTPSTVSKTSALHPDMQPHIDDVTRRKHDQKPSKALETGSCTANIFPGYVQVSARGKAGQLDVRKICSDQHASFIVSLRCLVASAVCPNLSH
jgi:hypothetical protein